MLGNGSPVSLNSGVAQFDECKGLNRVGFASHHKKEICPVGGGRRRGSACG